MVQVLALLTYKLFVSTAGILRFCGDVPSGEMPSQAVAVETAQKLLHQVT